MPKVQKGTAKELCFASNSGITVVEVRAFLAKSGWTMDRDKAYKCRRWILRKDSVTARYIRYNPTMGEMLTELKKVGIEKFCDTYETARDNKTAKIRKEIKIEKKVAASKRVQRKNNKSQLGALNEKYIDLVVKSMNIALSKNDKVAIRAQIDELKEQALELGGELTIGTRLSKANESMTAEDMAEARRRGEEKKRERKEKRLAKKRG